jgi:DNA-binding MarR family transcriptional regulator
MFFILNICIRNIFIQNRLGIRREMIMSEFESSSKIIDLIRNLNKSMRHRFHDFMQDSGLTFPQLSVISTLTKNGEVKVSVLSNKIGLSDSTVSGILDRLEQKNIIRRERNQDDRRVVKIALTEGSRKFYKDFHKRTEEHFSNLLKRLSEQEIKDIIKGLETLNSILSNGEHHI